MVIDEDQGKSGSGRQARSGFGHLLTAVLALLREDVRQTDRTPRPSATSGKPIIETPPERTWIWSDLHLADRSILLVWNRPFWSIEEMNRHLLTRWSEPVGAGDTIICLGDVAPRTPGAIGAWSSTYATVPASSRADCPHCA